MTAIGEWKPYSGSYDKSWYDLKLTNGRIVRDCWPNAGRFHSFHEEDQFLGYIDGDRVAEIQEVDNPFFREVKDKKRRRKRRTD